MTETGAAEMEKPLLSICIPTYNRGKYLAQCLEAIVSQEGFDGRVEVVISDNCSADDTQRIGERYQAGYENIRYFRNSRNVEDRNFMLVFQKATGSLRKLTNDTIIYKPGALRYMLEAAEENMDERPQVYFLNSGKCKECPMQVSSMEQYIGTLGYHLTWIASVAVWDTDCDDLGVLIDNSPSRLGQVPFLLENFENRGRAVIYDRPIMGGMSPEKKDLSYGLYKVFYENFLGFIRRYSDEEKITQECYERVRKELLLDFFCRWIINWEKYREDYLFADEDLKQLVEREYRDAPYFGEYKCKLAVMGVKADVRKRLNWIWQG